MLKVNLLSKKYGNIDAVSSLSFEVKVGDILGILGANGSGKSTTLKMLAGILSPTSGNIYFEDFDYNINLSKIREQIAYVPELPAVYSDLSVIEYLEFVAGVSNISESKNKINEVIKTCNLEDKKNTLCKKLSKGYKQRLSLSQALIRSPKLLLLDEPGTGLDPDQLLYFRNILKEVSKKSAVIISSHQLQEAKKLCNKVIGIQKGSMVFDIKVSEETNLEELYNKGLAI